MGISNKFDPSIAEVDVIIAGGGTAACTIAGRLAAADASLSILVIESGSNNYNVTSVTNPALFLDNLAPTSKSVIWYQGKESEHLAGRAPVVATGGILGGGSSVNWMIYTRAQRSDFDSWNTPGWSSDELLPHLKNFETYHGASKPEHHGFTGPVHISDGGFRATRSQEDYLAAAAKVGYPEIVDLQNLDANNGYERWLRFVGPDGKRSDAAHAFLHPLLQDGSHPNLHVLTESKVVRVLFDDTKRAIGVDFKSNAVFQPTIPGQTDHPIQSVKARKLVVVSCGALGTPAVLERSGLGGADVLGGAGIPLVVDLPAVGSNYQDHPISVAAYRSDLGPHESLDGIISGRVDRTEAIARKDKMLGWNGLDVLGKIRPKDSEIAAFGDEFQAAWDRDYKDQPNRPLMISGFLNAFLGDPSTLPKGQYITIGNYIMYPYSRGHVHITGSELLSPLDFDLGFFSDANNFDVKAHIWAYRKSREIIRRTKVYRGELAMSHPAFPPGSKAACVELDAPLENVIDLEYDAEDDKAIELWLRQTINSNWHSLGTARMAPREDGGVVDSGLNVYGVTGLKLADLSIFPRNICGNTNSSAFLVGEKAADIILKEFTVTTVG